MRQQLITLLKKGLYTFAYKNALKGQNMRLSVIFHTERIYDQQVYDRFLAFCQEYKNVTGVRAICCIIPATNLRVQQGMLEHGVTEEVFLQRVLALAQAATLGYHGHFWIYNHHPWGHVADIRSTQAANHFVGEQMQRDIGWFQSRGIVHNGLYAGGWWYQDASVVQQLVQAGFVCDFSCSYIPYFFNRATHNSMCAAAVPFGMPMLLHAGENSLLSIQNLVSVQPGAFVQDFDRNLAKYLPQQQTTIWGVLNAHDYDLLPERALQVVHHLQNSYAIKFLAAEELMAQAKQHAQPVYL